ncbi:putative ankyrin repeat protein RF_0381 [Cotesia glomerata]|uniref:putative ankyrin repeat protein RF_0381 n=1 Tax=Cotesia glomerata TaxID=32391 RepID=UPI001D00E763|nr:putative ankyrin repeat protein RF_0381 [Cotesia glomerata]
MAVNSCDVKLIQNLLKFGDFNVNSIFSWDRYRQISVLQFAILNSCDELIDFLLKNHVELNISTNFLGTALHVAIKQKNLDVVKKLVSSGADINIMPSHYETLPPLHRAIESGTHDITEFLVKSGADVNLVAYKAKLTLGWCNCSPLNLAILLTNVPVVELLLKHNAIIDQGSNELRSSLLLAVLSRYDIEIFQILEKFGAKFEIIKDGKYTEEFIKTVTQDNVEIFKIFVKKRDNFLDISALNGDTIADLVVALGSNKNILRYLLDYGINVNKVNKNNLSLLDATKKINILQTLIYNLPGDESLEIIEMIENHIIKLSVAGLYVNEKNSKAVNSEHFKSCLVKNLHKLAVGLRHSDFCFNTETVLDEFPVYGSIMIEKLRRAVKRKELLNNATELYHILYKDLPDLVIRNIFNYLNDEDLKLLSQ